MKLTNGFLSGSISRKIWFSISILIVAYCLTITMSFLSKGVIRQDLEEIAIASEKIISLGQDVVANMNRQMQSYQNAVVADELSMLDEAGKFVEINIIVLDKLEKIVFASPSTIKEIQSLKVDILKYHEEAEFVYPQLIRVSESGDASTSEEAYERSRQLADRKTMLISRSAWLTTLMVKDLTAAGNSMMNSIESQKMFEVIIFLSVLFVSIVLTRFVINRFITRPIADMTHALEAMENGDFNLDISHRAPDEIGRMADSMREMVKAQREKITFAQSIAEGDLRVKPEVKSENDILGKSFQAMVDSLNIKADMAEAIAEGDLTHDIQVASTKDRVGKAFQTMTHNLRAVVRQAIVIADGDLTPDIMPKSEKDKLGSALWKMTTSLRRMSETDTRQSRIKTGQNELSERMRGDQDIFSLCRNVIVFLSKYLETPIGSLYIFDEDKGDLIPAGTYALDNSKGINERIRLGQGLVGQAGFEKRMISVSDIPEDYMRINSAHGHALPRNIVVLPIVYEDKLTGVMEFGSFKVLSHEKLEFLDLVMENIAIGINSAKSREKMKGLLEETQCQSEELQQQQDTLKAQQRELHTTNEDLEKKTRYLEEQKDKMSEKNIALEAARKDLERKAEELAETNKYKSEFLANMSHELRSPLNSLLILSNDLADNNEGTLLEEQVKSAQIIHSSGNQLLSLINDILDLSKVEAGKMPINIETVRLGDIAEHIGAQFERIAKEKGLELKLNMGNDLRPVIRTDQQRMEQIIRNLVSNAVKFTTEGGITIDFHRPDPDVSLTLRGLDYRDVLGVSVVDTGIGIPEDRQGEVFEAFRQADGSTSRKYGGSGLGLSISREFAELLGGEIQVKSEPGKGSTFTLFIPFDAKGSNEKESPNAGKEISMPVHAPKAKSPKPTLKSNIESIPDDRGKLEKTDKIVLVIEDDAAFAKILMDRCHTKGFKCLAALNGEDGLDLAEKYMPDAVILDIKLPGIDGRTVLRRLKENPKVRHMPVHVISANADNIDTYGVGASSCFVKPVTKEDLETVFHKIQEFSEKKVRRLLVVEDDADMAASIMEIIGNSDVEIKNADSGKTTIDALKSGEFDCMVLDLGLPDMSGIELLQRLETEETLTPPPVIVYTGKELDKEEINELRRYSRSIITKGRKKSEDRLLDETALFLHRVLENMPKAKQEVIAHLHDSHSVLKDKKVLVVDDDMRNVFVLTKKLKQKGTKVFKAENGERALMILDQEPDIDLVLMDVMMPVMDGLDATREIRAQSRFSGLPIIALTARAMEGDRNRCLEAGVSDYLPKPVDLSSLFSMMRVWLN